LFISCLNCKGDRYLKKLAFSDLEKKTKQNPTTNKQTKNSLLRVGEKTKQTPTNK